MSQASLNPTPKESRIIFDSQSGQFTAMNCYAIKNTLKATGWHYHQPSKSWQTPDANIAKELRALMDDAAKAKLDHDLGRRTTQHPPADSLSPDEVDFDFALVGPVDEDTNACPPEEPGTLYCFDCEEEYKDGERHTCRSFFEKWIAEDADPC